MWGKFTPLMRIGLTEMQFMKKIILIDPFLLRLTQFFDTACILLIQNLKYLPIRKKMKNTVF